MIVRFQMKVTLPTGPATETPVGPAKAEDPAGTLVTRRLKLSPRKAKWPVRLILCIAIHFI
ncbi:hypothetical protein SAMN04487975_12112 [Planococcus glaciei]|nr:hypothetical protein SAMN04487975_12112 [Planococcus glaciei]